MRRWARVLGLLPLALAVGAVYAGALRAPFVFADLDGIVHNLRIREPWRAPLAAARPVAELTLAWNHALGGLGVVGYHAVNVALHLLAGLLLFDLVRRTLRWTDTLPGREATVAWWAAVLFLVHPLQTEAVVYVSARGDLLASLCYLAVLELVVLGEAQPRWRLGLWTAAIAVSALGMASHPLMVTAPIAAVWLARTVLPQPAPARVAYTSDPQSMVATVLPRRWPLYLGLAATWALLAYLIERREPLGTILSEPLEPIVHARTQLGVTWHYLRLLVWPAGQSIDVAWPPAPRWAVPAVLGPLCGWLAVLGLLAWLVASGRRAAGFWLGVAVLALAPTALVPVADPAVERRAYLTVAGFAVLAALAGVGLARRTAPRLVALAGLAVVVALGARASARVELWRDPVALWADALAQAPRSQRVFRHLADAYRRRGDPTSAARVLAAEAFALERAERERPRDPRVLLALGDVYARLGRMAEALAVTREAVRLAPQQVAPRAALGALWVAQANPDQAVTQLEIAAVLAEGRERWIDPDTLRAVRTNLGWAYAALGRSQDALRVLRLAAGDEDVLALNNLGSVLGGLGEWEEARRVLERASAKDPSDPTVQSNLGWVYANLGRFHEASALLEQAILRRPNEAAAHGSLGWVRLRSGEPASALHALTMAQALEPENAWVLLMLGIARAQLGEWKAATAAFDRAVRLAPRSPLARESLNRVRRRELPPLPPALP